MSEARQNKICLIVGGRGTGKTTFTKSLIKINNLPRTLIVDTLDHPSYREYQMIELNDIPRWIKGVKRVKLLNLESVLNAIVVDYKLKNTLIIFEDATKYFRSQLPENFWKLIYDSKQDNNDIILLYHGFKKVLPEILDNVNTLTLMKISEKIKRYESKIPDYEDVIKINRDIQQSDNQYINKTIKLNG